MLIGCAFKPSTAVDGLRKQFDKKFRGIVDFGGGKMPPFAIQVFCTELKLKKRLYS